MNIFTALHARRSIRQFTQEPVSEEHIHTLLDAAMVAPSAGNSQPWQFVVINDPTILAQIPAINIYAAMAPKAPISILVCGDTLAEKYRGFWVQDCAAATQNILLAATGLGLGAVWTGIYPLEDRVEAFSALLQLPKHVIPLSLVVIGHTTSAQEPKSRFDSKKVHVNTW